MNIARGLAAVRIACENTGVNLWLIAGPVAAAAAAGGMTAYGAVSARSQLFGPTICRTSSPNELAITFDDGPNPAVTPKLLDLLQQYDARATFFLIGRFVRECPDLVREIAARGHALGNHSDTHANLFRLGPAQIRDELRRCHSAIAAATGHLPKWCRPPWGWRNPWLAGAACELDMRVVMWTTIPGDWRAPSPEWLIARMQPIAANASQARAGATCTGDILCLHDGNYRQQNADRTRTLAALAHCLPRWRDLGLKFVTIDNAVRAPVT